MMKRLLVSLLFVSLLFTSCSKLGQVEVKAINIKNFKLLNTSSADLEVEFVINNPTNKTLVLSSADGFLKRGNVNFAMFSLGGCDTVAANRISVNRLIFRLNVIDPLSLLSMGLNLSQWKYSDFKVDARAVINPTPGRKRVIKIKDMPLENLAKRL